MANNERKQWEERAQSKGASYRGVLLKAFSDELNGYLHEQHISLVVNEILPRLPYGAKVLDVGCGYGRISKAIVDKRPDIQVTGMDYSLTYCRIYKGNISKNIICGSVENMPIKNIQFDLILLVTVLMYVPTEKIREIILSLEKITATEGCVLIIEIGREFNWLTGIFHPSSRKTTTGGTGLCYKKQRDLFNSQSLVLEKHGGVPVFSLLSPILFIFQKHKKLINLTLKVVKMFDAALNRYSQFSIHRWFVLRKR